MSDLTEFLLARIAEDEASARREGDYSYRQYHEQYCGWRQQEGYGEECQCGYPARVLADCEARKEIVELHKRAQYDAFGAIPEQHYRPSLPDMCSTCCDSDGCWSTWPCPTLLALAAPFSDHPDFNPEWAIGAKVKR